MTTADETTASAEERLARFARGLADETLIPWAERLPDLERLRLRSDLALVLAEPDATGEPLDWREIRDVLQEYAEVAGWSGPLDLAMEPASNGEFRLDVRSQELAGLETASPAVRQTVGDLLARFLPVSPTAADCLERGRVKKLANRGLWQIDLPDGYRLQYVVDELERIVYVTYLGPHPDNRIRGREKRVRAGINLRRKLLLGAAE